MKIIVTDDEKSFAKFVSYTLEKMGYNVRTAHSGEEALSLMKQEPADILITDMSMPPGMSGLELTEKVLQMYPNTLVIAITGRSDLNTAVEFMKHGGFDYLQKPASITSLRIAVESAVDRWRLRQELKHAEQRYRNIFENAPIGIYHISLDGKPVKVNPALAQILRYSSPSEMLSAIPNVISQYVHPEQREKIIEKVLNCNGWLAVENELFRKDKTIAIVKTTLRAVQSDTGEPLYIEGFVEDITEKRHQEELFRLEMARAKEIYNTVVQPRMPVMTGAGFNIKCIPAESIGGDVVDIFKMDEKRFLIFLADVTGHGIPAAMTANTLKMLFKEISEIHSEPDKICNHLNRAVFKTTLPDDIIAAFCGKFDMETMMLTYCLCGIPSPLIIRRDKRIYLEPTGLPLGVFNEAFYTHKTVGLTKADLFIAFTDGITEAVSKDGKTFGLNGVEQSIGKRRHDMHSVVDSIFKKTAQFQGKNNFLDDIIILAVQLFEEKENISIRPWNQFCSDDKCLLKIKSKYMNMDVSNFFLEHTTSKFQISFDDTMKLRLSLLEILTNAFEHGNLEMSKFRKNSKFYQSETYRQILKERLRTQYGERLISIESSYNDNQLKIIVEDEGNGFDPDSVPDPTLDDNLTQTTGRGIYIAKMSMDKVIYNTKGNKVTLIMKRN